MMQPASFSNANTPEASTARWLRWSAETGGDKSDVTRTSARLAVALCHLLAARGALLLSRRANSDQLWPLACHFPATQSTLVNSEFNDNSEDDAPHCARDETWPSCPLPSAEAPPALQTFLHELSALMDTVSASNSSWQEIEPDAPLNGRETALQVLAGAFVGESSGESEWLDSDNVSADVVRGPSQIDVAMNDENRPFDSFAEHGAPSLLLPLHDSPIANGKNTLCGLVALWLGDENDTLSGVGHDLVQAASVQAADWLATAQRMERLGRSYRDLAHAMARAIDERDSGRENRSSSVSYLCGLIGQALDLDDVSIERLEFAGLLHGAGRIALPDKILHKQGPLKAHERDVVREALHAGAQWFEEVDGLEEVAEMIRHQNERFDGSGYPDGLKGEEIPLGSRILAIALRFAAMTQPRAQRAALPLVGGAFQNLRAEAGNALDPQIVSAFFRAMGEHGS